MPNGDDEKSTHSESESTTVTQDESVQAAQAETDAANAEAVRTEVREARSMIPVTSRGVVPENFQQQVDFAKDMARGRVSVPAFLQQSPGDCLAIIDIASRAGLSPYMLAGHSYSQNGRLCFESQVFHALLQSSGYLQGELDITWEGEGDAMICIVRGRLATEPDKLKELRSQPLKDLHPGHVEKVKDGAKLRFVKGSPEWDRKPRKQMAYDTIRDWVRLYTPRATLGIMTRDEMLDWNAMRVIEAQPEDNGLQARLTAPAPTRTTQDRDAETELKRIAPKHHKIVPAVASPATRDARKAKARPKVAPRPAKRTTGHARAKQPVRATKKPAKAEPKKKADPAPARVLPKSTQIDPGRATTLVNPRLLPSAQDVAAIADRAERRAIAQAAMDSVTQRPNPAPPAPAPAPPAPKEPTTAAEYRQYAERWIERSTDADDAAARWDGEREMRDTLNVSVSIRGLLADKLMKKFQARI